MKMDMKNCTTLKNDEDETTDVAAENKELVQELSEKLFNYLDEVGAKFPVKDPEYDPQKEKEYLQHVKNDVIASFGKTKAGIPFKRF